MTQFPPPAADPAQLGEAARRLAVAAGDLDRRAAGLSAGANWAGAGWAGTAAVLMLARAGELGRGAAPAREALLAVSAATRSFAAAVELASLRTAALNRRWTELADQTPTSQTPTSQTAADQTPAHQLDAARSEADQLRAALVRSYQAVCEELQEAGFSLERALRAHDPVQLLPDWLAGAVYAGRDSRGAVQLAATSYTVGRYGRLAWDASRLIGLADPVVRQSLLSTVEARAVRDALLGSTQTGHFAAARTVLSRVALPLTVYAGLRDASNGGGRDGARGVSTRVFGVLGAAGGVGLLSSSALGALTAGAVVLGPVGLGIAGAAVVAAGVWSLGNAAYDHRREISAFASRAGNGLVRGAQAVGSRLFQPPWRTAFASRR